MAVFVVFVHDRRWPVLTWHIVLPGRMHIPSSTAYGNGLTQVYQPTRVLRTSGTDVAYVPSSAGPVWSVLSVSNLEIGGATAECSRYLAICLRADHAIPTTDQVYHICCPSNCPLLRLTK